MTKVEIFSNQFPSTIEGLVNNALCLIENNGGVVKDIKYASLPTSSDVMIIYEDNLQPNKENDEAVKSQIHEYSEAYLTKMFSEARKLVLSTDLTGFRMIEAVTLPLRKMIDDAIKSENSDLAYHAREFSKAYDKYQHDYFA